MNFSQSLYSTMESSKRLQGAIVSSRPLQTSYQINLKYFSGNATGKCKDHYFNIYCN